MRKIRNWRSDNGPLKEMQSLQIKGWACLEQEGMNDLYRSSMCFCQPAESDECVAESKLHKNDECELCERD
jgi:hypothetical protein